MYSPTTSPGHRAGRLLLAFVFIICSASSASAYSGFTQAKGGAYLKLSGSTASSNKFYDLIGNLNDRGQAFTQRGLTLYGEYGILSGLTAIANVPLLRINSYENTDAVYGFGDLQAGLRYGLSFGRLHVAASVLPEFPTGRPEAEVKTETGASLLLPTGDGEFNVWSQLAVSLAIPTGTDKLSSWLSAGGGYNVRTKGYSDQVGFGAELGVLGWNLVMLQGRLRGQITPSDEPAFAAFIYGEGTEYLAVGAGLGIRAPKTPVWFSFDWEQPIALQQNLYSSAVFLVGVAVSIPPPRS